MIEQVNDDCDDFTICSNDVTADQLANIATVVNTLFFNQEDVTNSAEIEQEAEQVNEKCEIFVALCKHHRRSITDSQCCNCC